MKDDNFFQNEQSSQTMHLGVRIFELKMSLKCWLSVLCLFEITKSGKSVKEVDTEMREGHHHMQRFSMRNISLYPPCLKDSDCGGMAF